MDPAALQIGSGRNSINPNTGQPEFADDVLAPPQGPMETVEVTGKRPFSMSYLDALTRATFGESEGEGPKGWRAAMGAIMNRVDTPGFADTVPGVVFQKNAFQSVSDGRYNVDPTKLQGARLEAWNGIRDMAKSQLEEAMNGNVPYAPRFFRRVGSPSPWFDKAVANGTLEPVGIIGNHEFYEDPKRKKP
jgi:spore germination cell wall hydrolase CwlJ-like protein